MRNIANIQARMGGSRLPGKVLLDSAGEPMLARVVNRVRRARCLDEVVIATTTEPADETLTALCASRGWPCFRGSQDDLLDRDHGAAQEFEADLVVRITSDCPLIEPEIIDRVLCELIDHRYMVPIQEPLAMRVPRILFASDGPERGFLSSTLDLEDAHMERWIAYSMSRKYGWCLRRIARRAS
jgi:spore coat polysaccharide biosynthesis protein SpsF (cytidylyltransferase family)